MKRRWCFFAVLIAFGCASLFSADVCRARPADEVIASRTAEVGGGLTAWWCATRMRVTPWLFQAANFTFCPVGFHEFNK